MCIHDSIKRGFRELMDIVGERADEKQMEFLYYCGAKHVFDAIVREATSHTRSEITTRLDTMNAELEAFEAWLDRDETAGERLQ